MLNYAGQFLSKEEKYTLFERVSKIATIFVPPNAEELADVSFWQAGMNWAEYKNHARAVILRVGQGHWKDVEFESNYRQCVELGIAMGGYVFFDGRFSPNECARMVIDAMRGKTFKLELYVDWERNFNAPYDGLRYVVALMRMLDAAGLNVKSIGIYTGYYFFTENADPEFFEYLVHKPLWLAWYAAPALVRTPRPWSDYTLWQDKIITDNWGQPTEELDHNKSRKPVPEFAAYYDIVETQPGETMYNCQVKEGATPHLNLREGPSTTSADIGNILPGTRFTADRLENGFLHAVSPFTGYLLASWCYYTDVVEDVVTITVEHNGKTGTGAIVLR